MQRAGPRTRAVVEKSTILRCYAKLKTAAVEAENLLQKIRRQAADLCSMCNEAPREDSAAFTTHELLESKKTREDNGHEEGDGLQPSQPSCPFSLTTKTSICFAGARAHRKLYQSWSLQIPKSTPTLAQTADGSVSSSSSCKTMEKKVQNTPLDGGLKWSALCESCISIYQFDIILIFEAF